MVHYMLVKNMNEFEIVKNGYNKKQVDRFIVDLIQDNEKKLQEQKLRISDLKQEVEDAKAQLKTFKDKNDDISNALVVAVETAKQIENSSKNIYQLEIKRVRGLYDKWNMFLQDFMTKYPDLQAEYDTQRLLKVFEDDINKILKQNQKSIEQKQMLEDMDTNTIGLKLLINKMSSATKSNQTIQPEVKNTHRIIRNPRPSEKTIIEHQVDNAILQEDMRFKKDMIKPIANTKLTKGENYENLVDKFLSDDDGDYKNNAYSKVFLAKEKNDGFNLKEAVNPTEDLEDIMKSFSFYNDDED